MDARVVVSLANTDGVHNKDGSWNQDQAKLLFDFSKDYGVAISGAEFMNEPNVFEMSGAPKGYTPADFGRDQDLFFRFIRENYPDTILAGPSACADKFGTGPTVPMKSYSTEELLSYCKENPDVFRELNVPTFMYVCKNDDIARYVKDYGLTLNPIFVKQNFDVLGANRTRIINEQNVYIDIENFLWEMKKEPESIPDNKTKIINAGFDLKTSFRNM